MARLSGYVRDKKTNQTLPGANIAVYSMIEGTSPIDGTTTNADGYFELTVGNNTYIEITYVGYTPYYPVGYDGQTIDYYLEPQAVHNPTAYATANRTYHKYGLAIAVLALLFISYKS